MSSPLLTANSSLSMSVTQQDSVLPSGVNQRNAFINISKQFISPSPIAIHEYSGVYTPNNDYLVVHQWTSHPNASVVVVMVDSPLGIQVAGSVVTPVTGCTIDRMAMFRLAKFTQGTELTLYLDGRTGTNVGTVAQGSPINWYVAVIDDAAL